MEIDFDKLKIEKGIYPDTFNRGQELDQTGTVERVHIQDSEFLQILADKYKVSLESMYYTYRPLDEDGKEIKQSRVELYTRLVDGKVYYDMAIDSEYDGRRFLIDGFEKSEEDEVKTIDVGNREKTVLQEIKDKDQKTSYYIYRNHGHGERVKLAKWNGVQENFGVKLYKAKNIELDDSWDSSTLGDRQNLARIEYERIFQSLSGLEENEASRSFDEENVRKNWMSANNISSKTWDRVGIIDPKSYIGEFVTINDYDILKDVADQYGVSYDSMIYCTGELGRNYSRLGLVSAVNEQEKKVDYELAMKSEDSGAYYLLEGVKKIPFYEPDLPVVDKTDNTTNLQRVVQRFRLKSGKDIAIYRNDDERNSVGIASLDENGNWNQIDTFRNRKLEHKKARSAYDTLVHYESKLDLTTKKTTLDKAIDKVAEIILRMDGQTPALPEATGSAKIARDRIEDMVYHGELSEMKVVKRNREKEGQEKGEK